jgi:hypothetical protein
MLKSIALAALAATALAAPTAHAATSQESLFQDDNALLYQGDNRREQTLDELDRLGVDTIRSNFIWSQVAPGWNLKRKPRFDGNDPGAYPPHHWERFDKLVAGAARRKIALQITITGPSPAWGSDCNGSVTLRRTCRPNPKYFGQFTTALARRYSGDYAGLPRVTRWSIWNEPNQAGWLYPQTEAPKRYRSLAYAAIDALRKNGHAKDRILLGETAPLGRRFGPPAKLNMAPLAFWRATLCINARGRRITSKTFGCNKFKQLKVTGAAHHPYTRGGAGSPRSFIGPEDVTLAAVPRLARVIDQARRYRRVPSRLPIYLTEYGFQTNPPDRYSGVSPSTAARWLNESDWLAYNNRRIRSVAQYELRDERPIASFQTGLRFKTGKAKPGLAAYRLPIWVVRRSRTTVWGQVRPDGKSVEIRYQPRRGAKWRRFKTVRITNSKGYFRVVTSRNAYRWRLKWKSHLSRAALPAPR